jgi:hypothetical protein
MDRGVQIMICTVSAHGPVVDPAGLSPKNQKLKNQYMHMLCYQPNPLDGATKGPLNLWRASYVPRMVHSCLGAQLA